MPLDNHKKETSNDVAFLQGTVFGAVCDNRKVPPRQCQSGKTKRTNRAKKMTKNRRRIARVENKQMEKAQEIFPFERDKRMKTLSVYERMKISKSKRTRERNAKENTQLKENPRGISWSQK